MGNYNFTSQVPVSGQIYTIIDNNYTEKERIPKHVYGVGSKVKVLGTKPLLSSRPNAPKILCSVVQFPDGRIDVYASNSLRS